MIPACARRRCEWMREVSAAMYMPLCVDSVNGFALVSQSGALGAVLMTVMLPFSVVAMKRYDKDNVVAKGVADDDKAEDDFYLGP